MLASLAAACRGWNVQASREADLMHPQAPRVLNAKPAFRTLLMALHSATAWQVPDAAPFARGLAVHHLRHVCPLQRCPSTLHSRSFSVASLHAKRCAAARALLTGHSTSHVSPPLCSAARHMPSQMIVPSSSPAGRWLGQRLNELREDAELERVANIVELPVMFTDEKEGSFDFDRWGQHRGPNRYGRLLPGILFGVTTRRISTIVALLSGFSLLVGFYHEQARMNDAIPEIELPLTPFELTAPVLGLLLVFRTNTAYERFDRGSDAAWQLTARSRSMIRQLALFTSGPKTPRNEKEASRELIDACCVLHGWIMGSYLRGETAAGQTAELLRLTLGERVQEQVWTNSLTPTAASAALGVALMRRLPSLDINERIAIDSQLDGLTSSLGVCEKLLRTPIPLGYTRYSVRFLWIWLTLLPFALVKTFSTFGIGTWWEDKPKPVLLLATAFIGFIFLSIEDIAVQIEEPFTVLPLEKHQAWLLREAQQTKMLMQLEAVPDHVSKSDAVPDHMSKRDAVPDRISKSDAEDGIPRHCATCERKMDS